MTRKSKAAPESRPALPSGGGSYVRGKDGALDRREFTRDVTHPDHPRNRRAKPGAGRSPDPAKED